MDDFSQFIYETWPDTDTISSYWSTVLAIITVAIIGFILRPWIEAWGRSFKKRYSRSRATDREALAHFRAMRWRPKTEAQRTSRTYVLRYLRKVLFIFLPVLLVVGIFLGVLNPIMERDMQQTMSNLTETLRQHLRIYDQASGQLSQRTDYRIGLQSFCEDPLKSLERSRSEALCKNYAGNDPSVSCFDESGARRYDICMLKRGWIVSPCRGPESKCVQVGNAGPMCEAQYWRTKLPYIGKECVGYIPDETMVKIFELECSLKATQFAIDSMYQGYSEAHRITSTARAYQLCMRSKGWSTIECSTSERAEDHCVTIYFPPDPCREELNKWIENDKRDLEEMPCRGEF